MRWIVTFILASLVLSALWPFLHRWLGRIGVGRMPLDLQFRAFGRDWFFPLGSTVLFTLLFWLVGRLLR
ncbi:MAG: DUF2905 domain-containing protein [Betaproteobacteria bacterium]|nr:DUF2905 family protein [Betaproteobacteria bacterium]MDE2046883.1 DUF2905 domain-containing protein [Betaproteobacteria bacterium]